MSIYQIAVLSLVFAGVFGVAALVITWIRDARGQLQQMDSEPEPDLERTIRLVRAVNFHDSTWTVQGYPIASSVPRRNGRR